MTHGNACLPIPQMPVGTPPTGNQLYVGDYLLFDMTGTPLRVVEEDEQDEHGAVIGTAHGLSTHSPFYVCNKLLFTTFVLEYQVWQNGPIELQFHDGSGMYRGEVAGPFDPPQGVRRFLSVYYPKGIGFFGIYGPPSGVAEGLILKVCPSGDAIGKNPAFPKTKQQSPLLVIAR
jgi:hypothetical protein